MRNLTIIYIFALTIIALVIGVSQYLVQKSIAESRYDSRTINISGRQSMLSQKITKAALAMEDVKDSAAFETYQTELAEAADLWERSHNALQYGNEELNLNNVNNSERTLLLFLEVEPHFTAMEAAVDQLRQMDIPEDSASKAILDAEINTLMRHEPDFLRVMNEITEDYDNESATRVTELSRTEYILLFIALGLLFLEGLLIFRPVINRINTYTQELISKEKSLEEALEEQKKEKAKVEFLNNQAQTVFENVNQGLFLLDRKFTISELHSQAMEDILESENIGGDNFINLMRPRLIKRDQDALEMFAKHLFNPEIDDEVLSQLNPIDQVEIYNSNNPEGTIESRFLRFSFARVWDANQIQSVLVNANDETNEVLMQRRISESEEKNKRESEQLLSILRVDASLLNEFLTRAKESLRGISERYEAHQSENYSELLNFTFNVVHNLKGNATLVELHLVADRLHKIENIIVELRDKANILGNDFLKILYEMSELSHIITNMNKMLVRIAEVNRQLSGEATNDSNIKLIDSLRTGLSKLCKEIKKPAQLEFDDGDVTIPRKYHLTLKDVTIQLLRNTLVHGIEDPDTRVVKGKPVTGRIHIKVKKIGSDRLEYIYEDDGEGLNYEKITQKAIASGLISPTAAETMTDDEHIRLLFSDGFSTATEITHHAGRGQGMSIIRSLTEQFDGSYQVYNRKDEGFGISIQLPIDQKEKTAEMIS